MAQHDHLTGCGCGLYRECLPDCEHNPNRKTEVKTPKRVKPPYPPVVAKEFQEACRAANAAGPVGSPGQPGYVSDTAPIEQVDHPPHYGVAEDVYETIKVIEAWDLGFCLGNAVKYISRAGKKGSKIEDLEKARWYVDREISRLKNGEKEQG